MTIAEGRLPNLDLSRVESDFDGPITMDWQDPSLVALREIAEEDLRITEGEAELALNEEIEATRDKYTADTLGIYLDQIGKYKLLTSAQTNELARRAQSGDAAAKDLLILSNLRLGVAFSKPFRGKGVPFLDLIQESNLGIMRAVEKFDPDRGFEFSTYAVYWIKQACQRAFASHKGTIKVPIHITDRMFSLVSERRMYKEQHGREPSDEELAKFANVSMEQLRQAEHGKWSITPASLNDLVGADKEVIDFVLDEDSDFSRDLVETMDRRRAYEAVHEMVEAAGEPHATIVRSYFGIDDGQPRSYETVAKELGLSETDVKNIVRDVINALREKEEFKARIFGDEQLVPASMTINQRMVPTTWVED